MHLHIGPEYRYVGRNTDPLLHISSERRLAKCGWNGAESKAAFTGVNRNGASQSISLRFLPPWFHG